MYDNEVQFINVNNVMMVQIVFFLTIIVVI